MLASLNECPTMLCSENKTKKSKKAMGISGQTRITGEGQMCRVLGGVRNVYVRTDMDHGGSSDV